MIEANNQLKHLDLRATGQKLDGMTVIQRIIENENSSLEIVHFDSQSMTKENTRTF